MVSGEMCPCHKNPMPVKVGTQQHYYQTRSDQWRCTSPFMIFIIKYNLFDCDRYDQWNWKMSGRLAFLKYTRGLEPEESWKHRLLLLKCLCWHKYDSNMFGSIIIIIWNENYSAQSNRKHLGLGKAIL